MKKFITWFPCWVHVILVFVLISSDQYIAAWFAGLTAFFAWQAIICRQSYFDNFDE